VVIRDEPGLCSRMKLFVVFRPYFSSELEGLLRATCGLLLKRRCQPRQCCVGGLFILISTAVFLHDMQVT